MFKIVMIVLATIGLTSCASYIKNNFVKDDLIDKYKQGLIATTENPVVYYSEHVELDEIAYIENSLVKMGYAYFEHQDFNVEAQAKAFAKTIGASVVLVKSEFKRTKTEYVNNNTYPISPVYVAPNTTTIVTTNGTTTNTIVQPYLPSFNYQIESTNGKVTKEQVSIQTATQLWSVPYDQRNSYAVPYGSGAVILPLRTEEREVEIRSYYISFWAKTNNPPALGVEVADISSENKKALNIIDGVLVWGVFRNSPASSLPIYRGDYLLRINNEPIISRLQMGELVRKNVGNVVQVELLRDNQKITKEVKLNNTTF